MATWQEVKRAKELGKKLRIAREEQGHNMAILASQCGLSVVQLSALELGNHHAFNNSDPEMRSIAIHYAKALNVDLDSESPSANVMRVTQKDWEESIPYFLRKKE